MLSKLKQFPRSKFLFKILLIAPLIISFYPSYTNRTNAGIEIQWEDNEDFKKLKWYQRDNTKRARNKIFFFLRPSDRKTGLLKISIKIPENFSKSLKLNKISLCKVKIGGFEERTRCIEQIPSDVEFNEDKTKVNIFPYASIPSSKESYAVVFKVTNPQRAGLYQFHSFGQSSGKIPVSSYMGSWTIKIEQ